mmetsp:Transcript_23981/g.77162  ORF Transcript_23981/g.77162 Transcript_23981/m.77162 type:complete len:503 (-) Transcript_23981:31-1539(-)
MDSEDDDDDDVAKRGTTCVLEEEGVGFFDEAFEGLEPLGADGAVDDAVVGGEGGDEGGLEGVGLVPLGGGDELVFDGAEGEGAGLGAVDDGRRGGDAEGAEVAEGEGARGVGRGGGVGVAGVPECLLRLVGDVLESEAVDVDEDRRGEAFVYADDEVHVEPLVVPHLAAVEPRAVDRGDGLRRRRRRLDEEVRHADRSVVVVEAGVQRLQQLQGRADVQLDRQVVVGRRLHRVGQPRRDRRALGRQGEVTAAGHHRRRRRRRRRRSHADVLPWRSHDGRRNESFDVLRDDATPGARPGHQSEVDPPLLRQLPREGARDEPASFRRGDRNDGRAARERGRGWRRGCDGLRRSSHGSPRRRGHGEVLEGGDVLPLLDDDHDGIADFRFAAGLHKNLRDDAVVLRLEVDRRLVGLDFRHDVARRERPALLHLPGGDRPALHRRRQRRQAHHLMGRQRQRSPSHHHGARAPQPGEHHSNWNSRSSFAAKATKRKEGGDKETEEDDL